MLLFPVVPQMPILRGWTSETTKEDREGLRNFFSCTTSNGEKPQLLLVCGDCLEQQENLGFCSVQGWFRCNPFVLIFKWMCPMVVPTFNGCNSSHSFPPIKCCPYRNQKRWCKLKDEIRTPEGDGWPWCSRSGCTAPMALAQKHPAFHLSSTL